MDLRLYIPSGKSWQRSGADGLSMARIIVWPPFNTGYQSIFKAAPSSFAAIEATLIFSA
jgi:hypothetical protein